MKKPLTLALLFAALSTHALADGDIKKGKKVFKKCKACHSLEAGEHKAGPSLNGIIGRTAGTAEGYDGYSSAVTDSGIVWSQEELAKFVANPKDHVPNNKMSFKGLKKEKDIDNLLAFLVSESGSD